jgi:hypothetical protein
VTPQAIFSVQGKTTPVVLDGETDVTGIELVLEETKKSELAGVVVDNWGDPVAGANVTMSSAGDMVGGSAVTATTDADGSFSITALGAAPFKLEASKAGYAKAALKDVGADSSDLELVLTRHGTVSGKIVTPGGAPPQTGGQVRARLVGRESMFETIEKIQNMARGGNKPGTPVKLDGTFTVEAPAGTVEIHAMVPGFAPGRSKRIEVASGQEYSGVEIRVSAGAVVFGKVLLADNTPVEDATVDVTVATEKGSGDMLKQMLPNFFGTGSKATTDNEGGYEIARLPAGKYSVVVTHPDYSPSDAVPVTLAEDEILELSSIILSSGAAIVGSVTENDKGKAGIMVQLISGNPLQQSVTDAAGHFRFECLKNGEYMLSFVDIAAMQQGKGTMKSRTVQVEKADTYEVEVIFGLGHKIHGTVKGLPPAPMRMLTLRRLGGPAPPEEPDPTDMTAVVEASKYQAGVGFITGENVYEVTDLEPGTYILEIPNNYRAEITVKDKDVKHDIEIKKK